MQIQGKKWTEIKDNSHGACDVSTNGQAKFKITILEESLCDYNDAYILVKETITITGEGGDDAAKQAGKEGKVYGNITEMS